MLSDLWRAYRPPAADVALAVGFAIVGQVVTWGQFEDPQSFAGPRGLNAVLNLLVMAALAWRRRAPLAAVSWAVAVYCLSTPVVAHDVSLLAGFLPLIVLTASAGYSCPRRRALLAAGIAVLGVTVVTLSTPWLRSPDFYAYHLVYLLAPWLAARGLREREDRPPRSAPRWPASGRPRRPHCATWPPGSGYASPANCTTSSPTASR